ncbi:MAG: exo-alpha-sialidase [Clostridia bacterium]|nr:exo-alpha-sialidase [Clostridia bacterium]
MFERNGCRIKLSEPELYVDNQGRNRSGHMSHAMAELANGTLIDFNSNCSPVRLNGHAAYGWIEYRTSSDKGRTFSDVKLLPYAQQAFHDGIFTVSVEKAAALTSGRVVAFCLRNDMLHPVCCEPWFTPMAIHSDDGGESWSDPVEVSPYRGRIYDVLCRNDIIYILHFCNDAEVTFTGNKPEHLYRLYVSEDGGESFTERSVLPMDTQGRGYGSILFDTDGRLHMYAYNINRERYMDHLVSSDLGLTWEVCEPCYLEKGIRNPQTALIDGVYILHGRGENGHGFVLYSSVDGYTWDKGEYLEHDKGFCYYSNNIVLREADGSNVLLIQYSDTYASWCVNVMHMRLKIEKI